MEPSLLTPWLHVAGTSHQTSRIRPVTLPRMCFGIWRCFNDFTPNLGEKAPQTIQNQKAHGSGASWKRRWIYHAVINHETKKGACLKRAPDIFVGRPRCYCFNLNTLNSSSKKHQKSPPISQSWSMVPRCHWGRPPPRRVCRSYPTTIALYENAWCNP